MGEAVAVVTGPDSTEGQGWRAPIAGWYELGGPEPVYLGPSSPVVPSVGAVPVEVTEDIVEAAAKAAADAVCPSSDYERWDRDAGEFVMQHDETGPDDAAFVSFLNTDGHRSVRGATYREVVAGAYPLIAARVRAEADAAALERVGRVLDVVVAGNSRRTMATQQLVERIAADIYAALQADDALTDHDARVRAEERQRMLAAMEQPAFMQAAIDRAQLTTFTDDGGHDIGIMPGSHAAVAIIAARTELLAAGSAVPVATPEPDDEHFPWHYTENGVVCACGSPMNAAEQCLAQTGPVATPIEPGTCPKCRHAAHGPVCFNMASDNDCACRWAEPSAEQDGQR